MTSEQLAIINKISIETIKESEMKGKKEGENDLIRRLLKHESPNEISKKLEIPLERITKLQNSK